MKDSLPAPCLLCGSTALLRESHIIPAFVVRWVKNTAATPYLRQAESPNLPRQDMTKLRLLCERCEELFSRSEKTFCERIFLPYQEQTRRSFGYDKWLLHFAVSLAWRTTVKEIKTFRKEQPSLAPHADKALKCWADYLLGRTSGVEPYAHHLLFWDPDTMHMKGDADIPDKFYWYILRSIDSTIAYHPKYVQAYTKLPSMIFWSGILPAKPPGWEGTIIKQTGTIGMPQRVRQKGFGPFLSDRVREVRSHMKGMSDKQRQRITDQVLADPERSVNSKSFEAFRVEQRLKNR